MFSSIDIIAVQTSENTMKIKSVEVDGKVNSDLCNYLTDTINNQGNSSLQISEALNNHPSIDFNTDVNLVIDYGSDNKDGQQTFDFKD